MTTPRRGLDALSLSLLIAAVIAIAAIVGALIVGASPGSQEQSESLGSPQAVIGLQPGDHTLVIDGIRFDFPAAYPVFQDSDGCSGLPAAPPAAPAAVYVSSYPYGSPAPSCPAILGSPSPQPTTSPSTVQLFFIEVPPEISTGFITHVDVTTTAAGQHVQEARGADVVSENSNEEFAVYFTANHLLITVTGGTKAAQQSAVDRVLASASRLAGPDVIANDPYAHMSPSPSAG